MTLDSLVELDLKDNRLTGERGECTLRSAVYLPVFLPPTTHKIAYLMRRVIRMTVFVYSRPL